MAGFYDARCTKCGRRYGWAGEATDNPGCKKCGWMPSAETLEADRKSIEDFEKKLRRREDQELAKLEEE